MKGNFKKGGWKGGKNSNKAKEIQINFFIIDAQKIGIQIPYGYCVQILKNMIRNIGEGIWSGDDKCWVINRSGYEEIVEKFQDHFWKSNNQKGNNDKTIKVNPIEPFVMEAEDKLQKQLSQIKLNNVKGYAGSTLKYISAQTLIDSESLPFYNKLFQFQKQCLQFGIKHHGRLLLADEMGVGKTIQSLAVAYIYRYEWPLLIICPPTLKFNWQNEVKRWYPDIQPHQIQLINNSKTALKVSVQIMIISYDLAWRIKDIFDNVRVVIADEAHYMKGQDSKRSLSLVPFLSSRKRVILLTGTPAFARPKQIFNLIQIIRPDLFKHFGLFGNRYCDPTYNHWSHAMEYNGCKNQKQLYYLLKNKIMIRRLKAQVLTQLPDKNRQKIILQTDHSMVKDIKQVIDKNNINKMETFFSEFMYKNGENNEEAGEKREEIMEAYRMSGMAKIKAVKEYIMEILQNNIKILVFAHHRKVMDEIQTELKNNKIKFMRIDGQVSQVRRQQNVQNFQNDPEILVALLSITAAGVGITLTAASTVIFAELHWTPALMIQAEDRAHRVGQKDSVNCHYLIGENTLDELLYRFLEKKVLNVSSFIDGESKDLQFEELRKGEKGKFSKKEEIFTIGQGMKPNRHFGSGMLQQLPSAHKKGAGREQEYGSSQQSELTDISASTGSAKPSRKRVPSPTLNKFITKSRPTVQEMPEYSYLEQQSEKYEVRKTVEFKDEEYYDQEKQEKVERHEKSQQKRETNEKQQSYARKKSKQKSIDSDQQFQQIYSTFLKEKSQQGSSNSQKEQKQIEQRNSQNRTVSPLSNSTRTLSNKSQQKYEQKQFEI